MKRLVVCAVLALGLLAACSDGDAEKTQETASPTGSPETSATPTPPENIASETVTSFSCQANSEGQWIAAGELTNNSKLTASYRVTVFLGSGEGTAHSQEVGPLAATKSRAFNFGVLTPADEQATCRIQVEKLEK